MHHSIEMPETDFLVGVGGNDLDVVVILFVISIGQIYKRCQLGSIAGLLWIGSHVVPHNSTTIMACVSSV